MDFNSKDMYAQGVKLLEDGQYEKAVELLTLSADDGNVDGQYVLGNLYAQGLCVAQNLPLAVKYYTLSAKQGHGDAQYWLGYLCQHGYGMDKDLQIAREWYQASADNGNELASYQLGQIYEFGWGVDVDLERAVRNYEISANGDLAVGQYAYGRVLAKGIGVTKDEKKHLNFSFALQNKDTGTHNKKSAICIGTVSARTKIKSKQKNGLKKPTITPILKA